MAELSTRFGVHATMIHQRKTALLDGASDVFEWGRRKRQPEIEPETIRELHAKIGELTVAGDFLSGRLDPWGGKRGGR